MYIYTLAVKALVEKLEHFWYMPINLSFYFGRRRIHSFDSFSANSLRNQTNMFMYILYIHYTQFGITKECGPPQNCVKFALVGWLQFGHKFECTTRIQSLIHYTHTHKLVGICINSHFIHRPKITVREFMAKLLIFQNHRDVVWWF